MVPLTALWWPILVAAVLAFVASSIIHMALRIHRNDFGRLPDEEGLLAAMRDAGVDRGEYVFPHAADLEEMKSPEMRERQARGPVGIMTVFAGPPSMGKQLTLWFAHLVVVSVFVAYVCGRVFAPGADYLEVFQVAGTVAIMAYALGEPVRSIWWGRPWSNTLKATFDGVVYGLLTAGVFGWLWPM